MTGTSDVIAAGPAIGASRCRIPREQRSLVTVHMQRVILPCTHPLQR